MKVIVFLTEPASYAIDLIEKVYMPNNIEFKFLRSYSYSKPEIPETFNDNLFVNKLSIIRRYKSIKKDYLENDVILFSGYSSFSFIILWLIHTFSNVKKPICIISDTPLKIPTNSIKLFIKKMYLNYLFKNIYVNGFAGGTSSHKELFRYYGMSSDRIHFLPMVVDVNQFNFHPLRKRSEVFSFLYVGRFIKLKQIELIINEFLLKFEDNNSVQLILIGDGKIHMNLKKIYSVHKNILFKGRLTSIELKNEFKLSHVFVMASNNENWGLVINEAMSSSLAILSNKGIGANYDLIINKQTGLIFDSTIKGDLSNNMYTLYKNKEQYQFLSKNAYNLMHKYWNFNLYTKQLILSLSKILKH